jgi:hypothetical protein
MPILTIKTSEQCKYDILSPGEVMLRLDPGNERIWTTRAFKVWEGGGEYNVSRGLPAALASTAKAIDVNREIAQYVDVMLGNEEDFTAAPASSAKEHSC